MTGRPPTSRAEASRRISALVERRFEEAGMLIWESAARLADFPPAETLPLHGRSLFAPGSTKLRLAFREEERPELDRTVPRRESRRYAASATFAVGDTIDHPKFGTGEVVGVNEGKIVVEFADEVRTLVHARG